MSALDVSVQAQILNLLAAIRAERGIGYLFITHDLSIVRQITDYLYVMHRGRIVESGPTDQVLASPADPTRSSCSTPCRARRRTGWRPARSARTGPRPCKGLP